ncbi:MAG: hypothetical protein KatS3mg105_3201 [Gemmatales bacterium]|nr:MAG: hypothetical protein KatS3mg105_3201 [Gemmatales bacterium]
MTLARHILVCWLLWTAVSQAEPLPGTKPLTENEDLAKKMVAGIDRYLQRATTDSVKSRQRYWKLDFSSTKAYAMSVQQNRTRFQQIIGAVEKRVPARLEVIAMPSAIELAKGPGYKVFAVRWKVFDDMDAEGLLLVPTKQIKANVVVLPDAEHAPEVLVGLAKGLGNQGQVARILAENGCRVLVPTLIDRKDTWSGSLLAGRFTNQPHREFIYRMAYEMGRHLIGYEVEKVAAAVDWCQQQKEQVPVGVFGYGEGGLIALYAAAIEPRIDAVVVSGYFGPRERLWREPIYRNVWSLLERFGDGELIYLVLPRKLIIEVANFKPAPHPPVRNGRRGAAPYAFPSPSAQEVRKEVDRVLARVPTTFPTKKVEVHVTSGDEIGPGYSTALAAFLKELAGIEKPSDSNRPPVPVRTVDPDLRQKRQFDQIVSHIQRVFRQSYEERKRFFWNKIEAKGLHDHIGPVADRVKAFEARTADFRRYLAEEVIGALPPATMPLRPRTRKSYTTPKWTGYEVMLDVYPDVFAYGILLVPTDMKKGERRPVVVCQHGLEGRPQDVVNPKKKTRAYNSFGAQLADRGYIVYAPQNPYIGGDDFRVLQRKANPLKLSLFSFIVRQHERTLDWLQTLPFVDPKRIAFYGLSYGGKTAMRVPALLPGYCLSICSGDFNEWIWKNVNVEWRGSYLFTGEYEMFEFDLGHRFNYAEMAALIAPRPFMVERGHHDGVGLDEYIAFEYAKVRRLYAELGIADLTELEFFYGGHEIHGEGTFRFLDKHLQWKP